MNNTQKLIEEMVEDFHPNDFTYEDLQNLLEEVAEAAKAEGAKQI